MRLCKNRTVQGEQILEHIRSRIAIKRKKIQIRSCFLQNYKNIAELVLILRREMRAYWARKRARPPATFGRAYFARQEPENEAVACQFAGCGFD